MRSSSKRRWTTESATTGLRSRTGSSPSRKRRPPTTRVTSSQKSFILCNSNHVLNLIRVGCKATAPPPQPPIPDRPNLEMLRRAAVTISTRQRRWGNNAGNQVTEKKKKANPEINIPEITTKVAPAITIKSNLTEKDEKIADKYGAPPPPPEGQCPAHLGYAIPLPPLRENRGAPSPN